MDIFALFSYYETFQQSSTEEYKFVGGYPARDTTNIPIIGCNK